MARDAITVLTSAVIIISTTAYAESSSNSPPPTQGEIQIVAQKLCKAEPVIGTRLAPKRKCDTPAQLAAYERQAREIIESYKQRPCMAGAEGGEGQAMSC